MKPNFLLLLCLLSCSLSFAQKKNDLKMFSKIGTDSPELRDILQFENIDYLKIKFTGKELADKSYKITVKEIWNGKITNDTVVYDSKSIKQFAKINDTTFFFRVIAKHTADNKLKVTFRFPQFSINHEYKALPTDHYSLRNIAEESNLPIDYDKKFYLLAYILPHKLADGGSSYCEVGANGVDIENWGKKFGIEHYLIFEMEFQK